MRTKATLFLTETAMISRHEAIVRITSKYMFYLTKGNLGNLKQYDKIKKDQQYTCFRTTILTCLKKSQSSNILSKSLESDANSGNLIFWLTNICIPQVFGYIYWYVKTRKILTIKNAGKSVLFEDYYL